jgi:hypothetical protein
MTPGCAGRRPVQGSAPATARRIPENWCHEARSWQNLILLGSGCSLFGGLRIVFARAWVGDPKEAWRGLRPPIRGGGMLEAHWPGPKAVVFRLASPIALAFLTDYPTPQAAARLGQARMTSFCRRHSYRGGKTPAQLLARLCSAPTAPVGIPAATLAILVRAQVQLLRTLLGTIAELEAAITTRVVLHPRAKLLASLPGVGTINLAQLLAPGSSLVLGCGSSGPAGTPASHMTPRPPRRAAPDLTQGTETAAVRCRLPVPGRRWATPHGPGWHRPRRRPPGS